MKDWRRWTPARHRKYRATLRRKARELRQKQIQVSATVKAHSTLARLKPIDAEVVDATATIGEEMLRLARLGVAKGVSDRALTALLVHFVHTFAALQE